MFKKYHHLTIGITLMMSIVSGQVVKAEDEFTQEQSKAQSQQIAGHLWLSALPYLTEEERQTFSELMKKGLARHHRVLKKESQNQVEQE